MTQTQQNKNQYIIAVIPKTGPALDVCIQKYRDFRLQVLEHDPDLAGSFEIEKDLPHSHFVKLVSTRHIIVAVNAPSSYDSNDEALVHGTWVGFEHMIGPIPLAEWTWPNAGGLQSDQDETRWHVFNLYVSPDHRGAPGLVSKMGSKAREVCIKTTRRLLQEKSQKSGLIRQRSCLSPRAQDQGLQRAYEKLDWRAVGFLTEEANLKASNIGYVIKDGKAPHGPDYVVMEKVLRIDSKASGDFEVKSML